MCKIFILNINVAWSAVSSVTSAQYPPSSIQTQPDVIPVSGQREETFKRFYHVYRGEGHTLHWPGLANGRMSHKFGGF